MGILSIGALSGLAGGPVVVLQTLYCQPYVTLVRKVLEWLGGSLSIATVITVDIHASRKHELEYLTVEKWKIMLFPPDDTVSDLGDYNSLHREDSGVYLYHDPAFGTKGIMVQEVLSCVIVDNSSTGSFA
ncbi:hypothetical protein CPB83DRAFT_86532 [Crepidotus variabilis]|uniref:Uncharacterized protein n=1 Tax=Crepidotus variabilis TaxID=179855 RepID=A0A9P6JSY4_9AGAR|nr:hypothetical protein CPB83DRAFT_86532 [Crepidotus variabilis]